MSLEILVAVTETADGPPKDLARVATKKLRKEKTSGEGGNDKRRTEGTRRTLKGYRSKFHWAY